EHGGVVVGEEVVSARVDGCVGGSVGEECEERLKRRMGGRVVRLALCRGRLLVVAWVGDFCCCWLGGRRRGSFSPGVGHGDGGRRQATDHRCGWLMLLD